MNGLDPNQSASDAQRLAKQRRNVLLATTLVTFALTTGADFGNTVAIQGLALTFERKDLVWPWLWLLMFYFWLRYLQHYRELDPNALHDVSSDLFRNAKAMALRQARADVRRFFPTYGDDVEVQLELQDTPQSGLMLMARNVSAPEKAWVFDVKTAPLGNETLSPVPEQINVEVPVRWLRRQRMLITLRHAVELTYFTEHLLPAVLPLLPIAIQFYFWFAV